MKQVNPLKNVRFSRYGDLVLLNESSLVKLSSGVVNQEEAENGDGQLLVNVQKLKQLFSCRRIALKYNVHDDEFRTPSIALLESNINPWVMTVENGIKYTFDVTKSMFCKGKSLAFLVFFVAHRFSTGNIKEKLRLAQIDCSNEVVVDLFAGIGYFALIFAVHCHAKQVYCCEWNPVALEALKRNCVLNKVEPIVTIVPGDNRFQCPVNVAHRVNMGLIPSSRSSLPTACAALNLKLSKWVIHFHENLEYCVESLSKTDNKKSLIVLAREEWARDLEQQVTATMVKVHGSIRNWHCQVKEIVCIKSYAPHIDHLVADVIVSGTSDF